MRSFFFLFILDTLDKSDKRTKDIAFVDLVKMLHRKLPLNIIYESIDIHKLDYDEIMKILKNTLIDIGNATSINPPLIKHTKHKKIHA
jgi:hypothetical protein